MRTVALAAGATLTAVVLAGVATDFGTAIYAEYHLSRTVRAEAALSWDPTVAVLGFPFATQALRHHYREVEIKALGAAAPQVGRAAREATLHSVDLTEASWLVRPTAPLPVARLESRIIIDSGHLGRFMGMPDLMVEAPRDDTNDPTGGTTESGISGSRGLIFTGTPRSAGVDRRVSVAVDLSIAGEDRTTLLFAATAVVTGPGTADEEVPADRLRDVLATFSAELPDQRLPFGVAPTSQGARGSDVIVEGITHDATVALNEFS